MVGCCYIFLGTARIRGGQGNLLEAYIYGHAAQSPTHARLCPCTYTRSCCGCSHLKALKILLFTQQERVSLSRSGTRYSPRDHLSVSAYISVDDVMHKLS